MNHSTQPWSTEAPDSADPRLQAYDEPAAHARRPESGAIPGVQSPVEARNADTRRRAIDRLVLMSTLHAEAAWQQRRRDRIEPHALAFLYSQPHGRGGPYGYRLTAATRLWLQDDHGYDVHQRIFRFDRELAEAAVTGLDVRELADRRDEAMIEEASFVGLGVCSLDTSTGSWRDVVATAEVATADTRPIRLWGRADSVAGRPMPPSARMPVQDYRDIPAAIRIVLTDGTIVVGERRGRPDFDHKILHATHTLDFGPGDSPYPWGLVTRQQLADDPAHSEVLRWMTDLCDLCAQLDNSRLDALRRRPQNRRAER